VKEDFFGDFTCCLEAFFYSACPIRGRRSPIEYLLAKYPDPFLFVGWNSVLFANY